MGMPNIDIIFTTAAQSAIQRSQKGTVAVILKDAAATGALEVMTSSVQVPSNLTANNQAYLKRTFLGYVNPPRKVLCYVLGGEAEDLTEALDWLATQQFDYLAGPPEITPEECSAVKDWILAQRRDNHAIFKAVLPETEADNEAIVNFATNGIKVAAAGATTAMVGKSKVGAAQLSEEPYKAADYCSRIAGMLAGTPMTYSCTYAVLSEVEDVTRLTRDAMDEAVDAGKFILFWDGLHVKTGRAVNSLTSIEGKSDAYKKIKIVETMDLMQTDLRQSIEDSYIGKYANSYDNKMLLLTAIRNYLMGLERDGVLQEGSTVAIDLEAQEQWLTEHGVDVSSMSEAEILQADTGSEVFISISVKILDAIEDVRLTIHM